MEKYTDTVYRDDDFYIEVFKVKYYPATWGYEPYVKLEVRACSPITGSLHPFYTRTILRNYIDAPKQRSNLYTKIFGKQPTWEELVTEKENEYVERLIKRLNEIREPFKEQFAWYYEEEID